MTSFFTQAELASDEYRMLIETEELRSFIVLAASIMGDLCDEILEPYGLNQEKFPDYASLCEWVRDSQVSESLSGMWLYYWDMALYVFSLYEYLSQVSDWELQEQATRFSSTEIREHLPPSYFEHQMRGQIIETFFALYRFVRGKMPENNTLRVTP